MPTPRYGHTAAALDGRIYIMGGRQSEHHDALDVVEIYDPATDTWETAPEPTREKRVNAAVVVYDGKIWLIGGRHGDDVLDDVEILDPATGRWDEGPELKKAREGLAAVVLNGTIYVVGGFGKNATPVPEVEYFAVSEEKWKVSGDWQPIVPRVATATVAVRDTAFTMGGVSVVPIALVERYHPGSGVALRPQMLISRADFAAEALGDTIYVFGGFGRLQGSRRLIEEVEQYVPATGRWSVVATLSEPREGLAAAAVGRKVYLFGGRTTDGAATSQAEEFSPLITSVASQPAEVPGSFVLKQNYPNPFLANGSSAAGAPGRSGEGTVISFVLKRISSTPVRLEIIDLRGRLTRRLVDRSLPAGDHVVAWDGRDQRGRPVSSGVYLYRLSAGHEQQVRKLTVIR